MQSLRRASRATLAWTGQTDVRTMAVLALALLSATAPLELSQLAFAMVGALAYAVIQALTPQEGKLLPKVSASKQMLASSNQDVVVSPVQASIPRRLPSQGHTRPEIRQPSSQPVSRPTFKATGWDAEVDELVGQITPSSQGEKVVKQLAEKVKRELSSLVPEIEVLGFASGDLVRGTAFGVAVPEVDIVASASPHILASRMQGSRNTASPMRVASGAQADARKLQKSTIRYCTDRLVGTGFFKFRRSAFRGQDPKVTLLASASLGIYNESIPLDFSVNSTTPLYNAALLTECGQIDPRSRSLILLVKRWAKDRGICHAAKGHLSPYAWTLLVIYFLQVGCGVSGPILPPLEGFKLSSGLAVGQPDDLIEGGKREAPPRANKAQADDTVVKSVGTLFKEFLHFYTAEFDFRNEAVSVRLGKRAAPGLGLPLQIILHEDGVTTEVAPSIEDPFDPKHNLGECSTAMSYARFREEFTRARSLCQNGESLSKLLEPWMPPMLERSELPADGKRDDESN